MARASRGPYEVEGSPRTAECSRPAKGVLREQAASRVLNGTGEFSCVAGFDLGEQRILRLRSGWQVNSLAVVGSGSL